MGFIITSKKTKKEALDEAENEKKIGEFENIRIAKLISRLGSSGKKVTSYIVIGDIPKGVVSMERTK